MSSASRLTLSIVSATLAMAMARCRSTCGRSASSRMRSAAGRSCRERSSWTEDCSALKPSNPSLAASRTTVAAPAPASDARSATVPNATRWGCSRTAWATRRSAPVSWAPAVAMRSATSSSATRAPSSRIGRRVPAARTAPAECPYCGVQLPPPPQRSFASDNASGAHPDVIAAIVAANQGHALAYGDDGWTRECHARFAELFGGVETLLTFTGTGGNVLGLSTLLRPVDAVVCARLARQRRRGRGDGAHRRRQLIDLRASDGKLVPEQLRELAPLLGNEHHVQPAVVSITQSTELGTVYTASEVAALAETAHSMGMKVHMDGARIANATAALGSSIAALRSFTVDAGVDVLTFGGTKNGLVGGEAVVFLQPALAERARYVRKMITQLPSKMRFVAAQFNALLDGELWLRNARHSNEMAALLYDAVAGLDAVEVAKPQVNGLFPTLPADVISPLQEWSFFWDWDVTSHQVRWMTSWDTTD